MLLSPNARASPATSGLGAERPHAGGGRSPWDFPGGWGVVVYPAPSRRLIRATASATQVERAARGARSRSDRLGAAPPYTLRNCAVRPLQRKQLLRASRTQATEYLTHVN